MTVIRLRDGRSWLVPAGWSAWRRGRYSYRRTAAGVVERRGLSGSWVAVPARAVPALPY